MARWRRSRQLCWWRSSRVTRPRLARRTPWVRRIAVSIVVVLVAAALWATALFVYDLIRRRGVSQDATKLLASGALVWLGNNLALGML